MSEKHVVVCETCGGEGVLGPNGMVTTLVMRVPLGWLVVEGRAPDMVKPETYCSRACLHHTRRGVVVETRVRPPLVLDE